MTRSRLFPARAELLRSARRILAASLLAMPIAAQGQATAAPADPLVSGADRGRILGNPAAPIWLLIVSDFQCPFCRQWHKETWEAVRKEFVVTGKVRVAYVNFPLGIHPNAKPAAMAAMCASTQGKFWEFADRLFDQQDKWKGLKDPTDYFTGIATQLKLGPAHKACLANPGLAALVDADYSRMARAGAGSTPTFFIGRSKVEGAAPISEFRKAIAAELAAAARKP